MKWNLTNTRHRSYMVPITLQIPLDCGNVIEPVGRFRMQLSHCEQLACETDIPGVQAKCNKITSGRALNKRGGSAGVGSASDETRLAMSLCSHWWVQGTRAQCTNDVCILPRKNKALKMPQLAGEIEYLWPSGMQDDARLGDGVRSGL